MMRMLISWGIATCSLASTGALAVDLPTALRAAEAVDPTLNAARANRDAAGENVAIARSRLLPQVNLSATSQHLSQDTTESSPIGPLTVPFSGRSENTQLSIRQGVFRPRDWEGLSIGRLQAEYGEYKLAAAWSDAWARTASAWLDVLAARAQFEVYAGAEAAARRVAEQAQRKLDAGDGTRDALSEARAQWAMAQAQRGEVELGLKARERAFARQTGIAAPRFDGLRLPLQAISVPAWPGEDVARANVLDVNAELRAARAVAAINAGKLVQAGRDHLPTLDFVASATRAQNDSTNTLGTSYSNTQFGLQLSLPLYSGGGISAAQRQQAAAVAAAHADADALAQRIELQLSADWSEAQGALQRLAAARELVEAAREQHRAAELGLSHGLRSLGDVSAAALQLARRQADLHAQIHTLLKIQLRMVALLPIGEAAWQQWVAQVSALASAAR